MAQAFEEPLSRRERQIMDIVYALGQATALEVVQRLPEAPSKTAVRTLLGILETKGHLDHEERGAAYVYRPTRPRDDAGRSALTRVLKTFFDGSLERAVAAHLAEGEQISDAELKRLASLIQQARKQGK
ncbi:MAG: BlaI/MecI/CopY family transcriptional regulator [Pirellulales bacterium]